MGARFEGAFSIRPNEVRIRLGSGTLVAVLRPIDGALFLSDREEPRPKKNIQSFFSELAGSTLTGISIAPKDRIVCLSFEDWELQLSFFGTPNAVLAREGETVASFKKIKSAIAHRTDLSDQTNWSDAAPSPNLLGKQYLREAAARNVTPEELVKLLTQSRAAFIHRTKDKIVLALIPLSSLGDCEIEEIGSINDAARRVLIERGRFVRMASLRARLLSSLDSEIERLHHSLAEMRKGVENSDRAERYAAIGNALLMIASEMATGIEEISVIIEERPLNVKLDRNLSPYENASSYFERSKRAKASKEELRTRTKATKGTIEKLGGFRGQVETAKDLKGLEKLEREILPKSLGSLSSLASATTHFREFTVAGGLKVLVGKNAKQNDELTTKVAQKEDLWLHARGVPGSHVVLQCGKRPQVPKEAIEQAAEIAAYFSDAKSQPLAPVSYTRKKYVRKPRGADVGAVVMEREEVIMVRPHIPEKKA
jgi:predicted ribosome quality control (RQC) complex YloA/Tae2 family protein